MFEKYLKRVDPKDIGLQQASEYFFFEFFLPHKFVYLHVTLFVSIC